MKTTCIIATALSLFATAPLSGSSTIQGGALAILGWAIWYLLTRALPRERAAFLAAQKSERQDFLQALNRLTWPTRAEMDTTNSDYTFQEWLDEEEDEEDE